MISFKELYLQENTNNVYRKSIEPYLKKLGDFKYMYTKTFTNDLGTLDGQLFVKNNGEAIQTNWKGNQLISLSYFSENDYYDKPSKELIVKNIVKDATDIGNIFRIAAKEWFNLTINESKKYIIEETEKGLTINGQTYYKPEEAVKALYDLHYMSLDNIAKSVKLPLDKVKEILGMIPSANTEKTTEQPKVEIKNRN